MADSTSIEQPFPIFFDKAGNPLDNGFIYIGEYGKNPQTDPIPVFWDEALTQPATQPIRTINGYYSRYGTPARVFIQGLSCSITVKDKNQIVVYSDLKTSGKVAGLINASAILDESGINQQVLNDGIQSIDEMRLLNPTVKGGRVYLASWHEGLNIGGGVFVATQKSGLVDDGGMIIATQNPNIFYVRINYDRVTPMMFGAKGDAVYDDRPAFNSAVTFLWNNRGGEVFVPTPPVEYRWKSYDVTNNTCLFIPESKRGPYVDPVVIRGEGKLNMIKVDLSVSAPAGIGSAIKFGGFGHYRGLENLSVWGGVLSTVPYVDYVLFAADNYSPNLTMRNLQFYVAKVDCIRLSTYVTEMTQVQTAYSPRGIVVDKPVPSAGVGAPCTAITLNSCYALNHTHNGYWFGELTYTTFNSCAADHIINDTGDGYEAYPYYIDIARGVTLNGCGAESSTRILHCRAAQGLTINGLMTLSIGNASTPPNALIRLDGGSSTVIGGLWLQNPQGYTYKLSVGNTFARECVVVLDTSIEQGEYTYTANSGRTNPVLLLAFQKSFTARTLPLTNTGNATTNAQNLAAWVKYSYDLELVHNLTVTFPSGDFPINLAVFLTNAGSSGYARVILKGNADGTSRIVCTGAGSINFGTPSSLARMSYTLDTITIHADSGITAGNRPALLYNANVYFVNSKFTSHNGAVQYATTSDSKIILDANSSIQTPALSSGIVEYTYKATTPPTTSTRLPVGTIFRASDPNATRIGWINTVDNGATWLALTP